MKKILLYFLFSIIVNAGFSQTILAQWNFNSNPADALPSTGVTTPSTGTGTISTTGGTTAAFLTAQAGTVATPSTDPAGGGDDSGWDITTFPINGSLPASDKTAGIVISVNTTGKMGIKFSYDKLSKARSNNTETVQYSIDGTSFLDAPSGVFTYAATDVEDFVSRSVDLTGITGLNNNANAKIRIVSTATSSVYTPVDAAIGGYLVGQAWRFDMVTVTFESVLPVELVKFEAKNQAKSTILTWTTASEKDNDVFKIEHSTNGKIYESIGEVKGKGTIYTATNYSFEHPTPSVGVNYYRLKQVDFDGTFAYSPVRSVVFGKGKFSLKSTLVDNALTVIANDDAITPMSIYSISGQLMQSAKVQGEQTINIGALPNGLYIVRTDAGDVARFTKQ
jgi:hypothetical protein